MSDDRALLAVLDKIADTLQAGPGTGRKPSFSMDGSGAFVWAPEQGGLLPVPHVAGVALGLLRGIDHVRDILLENTARFAAGLPANNALLWGARGMGKSSLVKAVHRAVLEREKTPLVLVEIHREDIRTLPQLMGPLRHANRRVIIFCDDLSFSPEDSNYKALKVALEGGIEGRPDNVLFYATSNRRHLMARSMAENEDSTAISPSETAEEKISLSDRFGLWLGFYQCTQPDYLDMVKSYAVYYKLDISEKYLFAGATEWATTRGSRSGRVAWQYIQDVAGRLGQKLQSPS